MGRKEQLRAWKSAEMWRSRRAEILDHVKVKEGEKYAQKAVDGDVKGIAAMDKFATVRAEIMPVEGAAGAGVVVRYVVVEKGLVTRVEIAGNGGLSERADSKRINHACGGRGIDQFRIATDRATAILKEYQRQGYGDATVTMDQKGAWRKGSYGLRLWRGQKAAHLTEPERN